MSRINGVVGGVVRPVVRGLTSNKGVGAWAATEASLKALYTANVGVPTPHTQAAMASPPTITTSAGSSGAPAAPYTALTNAYRYSLGTTALAYLGGGDSAFSTIYRRFPVATHGASGGNVSTTDDAVSWRIKATVNAAAVAFRLYANNTTYGYRFIVDGKYVQLEQLPISLGGRGYVVLDFGSKAARNIIVEGPVGLGFDGIHVAVGDTVTYPPLEPRIALFLGDSFTAGAHAVYGSTYTTDQPGDGYYNVLGEQLGFENIWASGVGGTGYIADTSGTAYNLGQRIAADINRAKSFGTVAKVFVAHGLNDLGLSGIQAAASADFDVIRSLLPEASVSVLGPWDVNAPSATATGYSAAKAAIQAAMAGRGGFHFLDTEGVAFAKYSDLVHPSRTGHAELAAALLTLERAALGA